MYKQKVPGIDGEKNPYYYGPNEGIVYRNIGLGACDEKGKRDNYQCLDTHTLSLYTINRAIDDDLIFITREFPHLTIICEEFGEYSKSISIFRYGKAKKLLTFAIDYREEEGDCKMYWRYYVHTKGTYENPSLEYAEELQESFSKIKNAFESSGANFALETLQEECSRWILKDSFIGSVVVKYLIEMTHWVLNDELFTENLDEETDTEV